MKPRPVSVPLPSQIEPMLANINPSVLEGTSHTSLADLTPGMGGSATVRADAPAPQPAAPAPAAPGASADRTKPGANNTKSGTENYLETGLFKDAKWADDAVERLSQQGFHAICVHRTVLWMQTYRVQVGPYVTSDQMDHAQEQLNEQGFKSHIVK